jgi:serine/threonine protein kinase
MGLLGKGGMGTVYQAEHRVMKRAVALKVIGAHLIADPAAVERFQREVEAAAKLSHPNIVTAHDAEQAGNCHFLVMELVDGIRLDRVLEGHGPLPPVVACAYARQTALGLQHAHEHGMVHRDIKPQNLMLTRKGEVKILDFGLARFVSENGSPPSLTECGELNGTPDFMAPEQAEDARSADIRADIYSLGCTLYTLLTGQPPFPGRSHVEKVVAHLKREPAPLTAFRDDLPPELVQIVGRMMAKDPVERFQTPGEAAKALLAFGKTGATTGGPDEESSEDESLVPLSALFQESSPALADALEQTDSIPASLLDTRSGNTPTSEEIPTLRAGRPRPVRRRNHPSSRWGRGVVVGLMIGAIGLLGLGGLLIASFLQRQPGDKKAGAALPTQSPDVREEGQGQVSILPRDPHLQLAIPRGPKVLGTLSPNTNPQMTLPVGEYEVQVVGGPPEVCGVTAPFSLAQGDRKVVVVRPDGVFVRDFTAGFPPPGHPGGPPPRHPGGPPPHHPGGPPPPRPGGPPPPRPDGPPPPRHDGPPPPRPGGPPDW